MLNLHCICAYTNLQFLCPKITLQSIQGQIKQFAMHVMSIWEKYSYELQECLIAYTINQYLTAGQPFPPFVSILKPVSDKIMQRNTGDSCYHETSFSLRISTQKAIFLLTRSLVTLLHIKQVWEIQGHETLIFLNIKKTCTKTTQTTF